MRTYILAVFAVCAMFSAFALFFVFYKVTFPITAIVICIAGVFELVNMFKELFEEIIKERKDG